MKSIYLIPLFILVITCVKGQPGNLTRDQKDKLGGLMHDMDREARDRDHRFHEEKEKRESSRDNSSRNSSAPKEHKICETLRSAARQGTGMIAAGGMSLLTEGWAKGAILAGAKKAGEWAGDWGGKNLQEYCEKKLNEASTKATPRTSARQGSKNTAASEVLVTKASNWD